jgi:ubiquinone/menaquinone biosynthesis C-methylase UbiE
MPDLQTRENIEWFRQTAACYDAYVGRLNLGEQHYLKREIFKLSRRIDASMPVIDFGSGTGNVAKYLERAKLKTLAVDISLEMLQENPVKNKIVAESQYLPFKDASFGMITACSVFHHLPNLIAAMEELMRIASPQCVVFFPHEPLQGWRPSLINRFIYRMSWLLWRLLHPGYLQRLVVYILCHRKRLRKLQASLKHVEKDFNLESIHDICTVMEKHGFSVQLIYRRREAKLIGYRGVLEPRVLVS